MKAHLVHAPLKSASHTGHRAARCCRIRYSHCTIERSFTETTWESFLAKEIFRARLWFIGMKVIFARSEIFSDENEPTPLAAGIFFARSSVLYTSRFPIITSILSHTDALHTNALQSHHSLL